MRIKTMMAASRIKPKVSLQSSDFSFQQGDTVAAPNGTAFTLSRGSEVVV